MSPLNVYQIKFNVTFLRWCRSTLLFVAINRTLPYLLWRFEEKILWGAWPRIIWEATMAKNQLIQPVAELLCPKNFGGWTRFRGSAPWPQR